VLAASLSLAGTISSNTNSNNNNNNNNNNDNNNNDINVNIGNNNNNANSNNAVMFLPMVGRKLSREQRQTRTNETEAVSRVTNEKRPALTSTNERLLSNQSANQQLSIQKSTDQLHPFHNVAYLQELCGRISQGTHREANKSWLQTTEAGKDLNIFRNFCSEFETIHSISGSGSYLYKSMQTGSDWILKQFQHAGKAGSESGKKLVKIQQNLGPQHYLLESNSL
jgi:hypothetical protein